MISNIIIGVVFLNVGTANSNLIHHQYHYNGILAFHQFGYQRQQKHRRCCLFRGTKHGVKTATCAKISELSTSNRKASSVSHLHFTQRNYDVKCSAEEDKTNLSGDTLDLQQKKWMFRDKYPIAYEVATLIMSGNNDILLEHQDENKEVGNEIVSVLLLNGFGVGSFHQHRLMRQMLLQQSEYEKHQVEQDHQQQKSNQHLPILNEKQQQQRKQRLVIYGVDYLGQGNSWPVTCNGDGTSDDEINLGYSADLWLEQLKDFIDEVMLPSPSTILTEKAKPVQSKRKIHLIGNSVGGYLGTILSLRCPQSIASLTLLNATPVWGLNLPGWDGRLPPPPLAKYIGGEMFDLIRNPKVIDMYLRAAYVHPDAYDGTYEDNFYGAGEQEYDQPEVERKDTSRQSIGLGEKIRACTEGKGGHAAFASILWSGPASEYDDKQPGGTESSSRPVDYYTALRTISVDVLLLFGSDDPWCTPAVAKRMHMTLSERMEVTMEHPYIPAQRYISLENVGHCPNHEAPKSVAKVVLPWILASTSSSSSATRIPLVVQGWSDKTQEPWGIVHAREISLDESKNVSVMDRIISSIVG